MAGNRTFDKTLVVALSTLAGALLAPVATMLACVIYVETLVQHPSSTAGAWAFSLGVEAMPLGAIAGFIVGMVWLRPRVVTLDEVSR